MEEENEALFHNSEHPLHALDDNAGHNPWDQQGNPLFQVDAPNVEEHAEEMHYKSASHSDGFQNAQETTQKNLVVKGRLPEWLIGYHYTVGPGVYDIRYTRKVEIDGEMQSTSASFTFGHWFDGLPLVNRFCLDGERNTITYRSRLTNRALVDKIRDHHGYATRHPAGLFKTPSNQTVLSKFQTSSINSIRPDMEPCGMRVLTTLPGLQGQVFCQNSANHIQILDPVELKPIHLSRWQDVNPTFKGYTASPNGQIDPLTGEYINFTMEIGLNATKYHFFSISHSNPKGLLIASIAAPIAFLSSFALTRRYIILAVFPYLADAGALKFVWKENILDSFSFRGSEPTLFYVVSREKQNVVAVFRSSACFAFNHVNAFEDDNDNVFLDIICYPNDTIIHQLATDNMRHPKRTNSSRLVDSEVRRYKLENVSKESNSYVYQHTKMTRSATVVSKVSAAFSQIRSNIKAKQKLTDNRQDLTSLLPEAQYEKRVQLPIELPQIHPAYRTKKYNYIFALGFSATGIAAGGYVWDTIMKANVETKSMEVSWHEPDCYPSEAVFVPRPSAVTEDEGVLISVVLDTIRKSSFILVLDARTLEEVARADLSVIVPLSFAHGSFRFKTSLDN